MKEIELILNCRQLTRVGADPDDFRALTPMTLLNGCIAPELTSIWMCLQTQTACALGYRATQLQADLFCQRWRPEYLTMLQKRHKWLVPQKNISPNTLVLMKEDTVPHGVWPKGIVVSVIPDRDEVCRRAVIRTANGKEYVRDIRKLCVLKAGV